MLQTLTGKEKTTWKDHINKLIFAYKCTKHSSTGYSPSHLLFIYKPRLPIDLILDQSPKVSYDQYLSKWNEAMGQTYSIAESKSRERKEKKTRRYKGACLGLPHIGDRVLVRSCTESGDRRKLRSYWENDIYKIVDCKGENRLVYEVHPGKIQDGKTRRVLHRNIFLPCEAI